MGKRLPNGRNDGDGRHVRLPFYLMDTPAWQSLDPVARVVYIELKRRYTGSNNGRISYAVREATAGLGISKSTAGRALAVLTDRGFIISSRKGTFDRKTRHASEWVLTEYPPDIDFDIGNVVYKAGSLAAKDFTRWRPSDANGSHKPVPLVGLSVPVVGPIGPRGGTVPFKKAAHGF